MHTLPAYAHTLNVLAQRRTFDRYDFPYMMLTLFLSFPFQRSHTVRTNSRTPTFTASLPHYIGHKLIKRQRETHLGPEDQVLKGATAYIFVHTYWFIVFEAGCNNLDQVL